MQFKCHRCGKTLSFESNIGRSDSCIHCSSDVRVCLNCRHYDCSRRYECKEEIVEAVRDKERGNFCDFFQAAELGTSGNAFSPAEELRRKAEALFKK